jgi:hypothetical protein
MLIALKRAENAAPVGASLLAKKPQAPRTIWFDALSFTTIVGTPPGAGSLLQSLFVVRQFFRHEPCYFPAGTMMTR